MVWNFLNVYVLRPSEGRILTFYNIKEDVSDIGGMKHQLSIDRCSMKLCISIWILTHSRIFWSTVLGNFCKVFWDYFEHVLEFSTYCNFYCALEIFEYIFWKSPKAFQRKGSHLVIYKASSKNLAHLGYTNGTWVESDWWHDCRSTLVCLEVNFIIMS